MFSNISSKYGSNKDKKKEEEEKKKSSQSNPVITGAQIAQNVLKQYQNSIGNRPSSSTNKTTQAQTTKQSAPAQSAGTQTQKQRASLLNPKGFMGLDDAVRAAYVYNSIAYGSGKASDSKMMEAINNSKDRTIRNMRTPEGVVLTPAQAYRNLDNAAKSRWLSSGENNAVPSLLSREYATKEINANWNKDWLTLAEERKEAEKQKKQADDYMAQFDTPIQEARSGITNQLQLQNNTVAPFDERPDDYNDYAENYDRILYDWGVGEKGAYEKIGRIGSREEILARNDKVKELWGEIDNESNRRYNEARRNLQEHKAEYDIAKSQSEYYGSQLEAIGNRERQRDEYFGLIDQYDDNLTRTDYVPEYDRGHDNAYGSLGELDRGVVTDDIHRIYSFVGGGKEWKSWNNTGKNQISPEYSYAMLMTDGSNGSFNEKGIFMNLYNQAMKEGREPVEAKAFLEGLQPALRARYSGYESVRLQEAARQMPIMSSVASLAMGLTNTYLDIPRHIAHLLGDKSTEDPNSWWYATTRQAQQIQDTVSENLGGIAGKAYLSFMNSASNLARGLTTAGAGGKVVQSIMGLGGFFLSVDQEATGRYLKDGYKYDQAQKMGAVDGMFEVAEEFLPFETMLGTEGAKFITSWVLNGLSEFGQEFTGGVLFDEIKATLTGQNDRNDRVNEIIVNGSYTDRDGNQVVLSDDPATAMQQARLQAGKEQFFNALEGGIGGFFGGGLAGFYGTANQAINDVYTGASINNETNVSDGKKAIESLIEVGKNTKDEGVQKLAEKVEGQYKGKGKAGDYLTGKLFRAVADATGEEGQETVKGTAWRFIRDDLTGKGVNREAAGEYADIVAKGLLGEKLTNEDKKTLARDQLAIDTWKRFNTATKDAVEILNEVNQATKENRSVMDTLGEIAGTKPTAGGAMGAELETSLQKTGGDMEKALDDMFSRRSDLLSERYVTSVKEKLADKKSPKNKSFLKDAMQIRAAAMTLGAMPTTSMDEETAKSLYDEARAEFDEIDRKRVLKQRKVEPGKGTASFDGVEYGTQEWKDKLAGQSKKVRNQAGALAEVAKRAGLSVTFIYDNKVDKKTGRDNAKINGFENQDGSIVINLAATEKFGKNMLTTMAHEMTHWLEQNSWEEYNKLREFVLGRLREKGRNVEQLAVNTIDNQNAVLKGGEGLDFNGAVAELVAKSCEDVLSSKAVQQELAGVDPGIFDKVKTFVQNFVARINAALKDMEYDRSLSWEARQLRDYTEEIGNLWIGARREALGRNAEEGAEAGEGTRFSTQNATAEDQEYQDAVRRGDEKTQRALVDAAAKRAGYTDKAYHGTTLFGFTEFDMKAGNGTIFVSYGMDVAGTYSRIEPETRRISSRLGTPENFYAMSGEELGRYARGNVLKQYAGDEVTDVAYDERTDSYTISYTDWRGNPRTTKMDRVVLEEEIAEWQNPNGENDGIYELYTRPGRQLVVDAKGAEWNAIEFEQNDGKTSTTRQIADWAKAHGYDSVRINNVHDNGGRNGLYESEEGTGDIGVFFDANAVKSADLVTYDESRNVIPLSERFNENRMDIRYSTQDQEYMDAVRSGDMDTARMMVFDKAKEAGVFTNRHGRPLRLYHGTRNFGFTVFDTSRTKFDTGAIFTTSNRSVANGYSEFGQDRGASSRYIEDDGTDSTIIRNAKNVLNQDWRKLNQEDVQRLHDKLMTEFKEQAASEENIMNSSEYYPPAEIENEFWNVVGAFGSIVNMDEYYFNTEDEEYGRRYAENNPVINYYDQWKTVREYYSQNEEEYNRLRKEGDGYYNLLLNSYDHSDALVDLEYSYKKLIDRENKFINEKTDSVASREELQEDIENWKGRGNYTLFGVPGDKVLEIDAEKAHWTAIKAPEIGDKYYTTDYIVKWAKDKGYSSVVIRNVMDPGVVNEYGDDYVFFDSNQLKSADPVTYDDEGNVIPLSERFNAENNDIRYSTGDGTAISDEENHPGQKMFSIVQVADAGGMRFDADPESKTFMTLFDENGNAYDGVKRKITKEMMKDTPVGMLIRMGLEGKSSDKALEMMTGLMNMVARYKDSNLVWEIGASTLSSTFSAMKKNSDPQYKTTVDFGTICAKTQAIIDVMSRVMLDRLKANSKLPESQRQYGMTRKEIMKVYNATHQADLSVPCPVCYVFSRWMGVPSLLGQMSQYQHEFVALKRDAKGNVLKDKDGNPEIDWKKTKDNANNYIEKAITRYKDKDGITDRLNKLKGKMRDLEEKKEELEKKKLSKDYTREEKKQFDREIDDLIDSMVKVDEQLREVNAFNWITQVLCIQQRDKKTNKMENVKDKDGRYAVDEKNFRLTPDEILFDLNRTGEFAEYKKNWAYRNTRGAGMGKAIAPYSGENIGDIIYGVKNKEGRQSLETNPWRKGNEKAAKRQLDDSRKRAKRQNLVGGQRLQSTSDFRPEWGLDYIMSFLELQVMKSYVQMYTKVPDAVDFFASVGADINLSIMGKGKGWHEDEYGNKVLDFSSITGMAYDTALKLKNKYDNVQMILVGMNDTHIRLALANTDIDFVIPWHSSGNSKEVLANLISTFNNEKLDSSVDYTTTQSDMLKGEKKSYTDENGNKVEYAAPGEQTREEKLRWSARLKIIMGTADNKVKGRLTAEEREQVKNSEWLSDLYNRFYVDKNSESYHIKMSKDQAKQIFPYEYWDTSLTKDQADENGRRFVEYCEHMGVIPRFSQFKDDQGYWKLLIDRPMYNRDGTYHRQKTIDVTGAEIGYLDESAQLKNSMLPTSAQAKYAPKDPRNPNYQEYREREDRAVQMAETELQIPFLDGKSATEGLTDGDDATFTPDLKPQTGTRLSVQNETDMNVNHFMLGLQEGSLQTEQERTMLRQYKELHGALEVSRFALADYRQKLARIDAMTNPSAYDRAEALKLRNLISNYVAKVDRLQEKMAKVTSSEGYAGMMYRQSRIMDDLVNGRTADEVTRTVSALNDRLRKVDAEIAQRQMQIDYLRSNLAGKKLETLVDSKSLDQMAKIIRKEYGSTYDKSDLMHDMTAIRLKMSQGQKVDADVEELTWKILQQTKNGGGEDLQALRGITITLGAKQVKELLGSNSSMKELRSIFAGTGVTIRTAKAGEQGLDTDWQQLCDMLPNLNRDAQELDQVDELIRFVQSQKDAMNPNKRYKDQIQGIAEEIQAMIATVSMNAPSDPAAMQILQKMSGLVDEMAGGLAAGKREMEAARKEIANLVDEGRLAIRGAEDLQKTIETAIQYNNALSKQSEAARWKHDKTALVAQLKDENTKALLKEQAKWKERIERDRQARESMATNMHLRHQINTNVTRIRKLLLNETDLKNIPEHMKSLAREMLGMILNNDITGGRKITGIQRKDIIDTVKALEEMKKADGEFTLDDLRMIEDEEAQAVVEDSLADIEDGITLYNGKPGNSLLDNLDDYRKALESIANGVANIVNVINAERYITQGDRQILVADAAQDVYKGMENSRFRGELRGRGSKAVNAARSSVGYGNLTPVYFIKNLRNEGMTEQFNELQRGENRSGLEYKKAQDFMGAIAEKTHYRDWAGKKISVQIGSRKVEMTVDNALEILAIWNREQLATAEAPDKSNHMTRGGIYIQQEENNKGTIRREKEQQRPMRLTESDIGGIREALTDEQKEYMDKVVSFLSNEMSQLGNEASMRMYGIKKYREEYYFPMKIWDGVKSARSDKGIAGTDENRAAHRSWSKRRINRANNALVIGNFTEDAVSHIVEMINYNTMAPAIENLNKVLNFKLSEIAEDGEESKRNVRIAFQEAYGKEALNYLETFLKDLNGGAVQDQRKTLRDRMLSVFKKNAVAGSLSVTAQQPLSYIRAALMLNPMDLARALSPNYWKGSWAEMQKYSGVAVIKDMGRFDMNFGQSAKDFIAPEKKGSAYQKISDLLTAAPEMADRMTWTRMWSACKIEQHRLHPEMDITSDEFLTKVAERFNDVMRKTQVYDSVLVKSSNMRSNNLSMKILTSFMAEPTLSLNVLADAARNIRDKGGKTLAAKAAATFLISAALQAAVKGLMGSGRTPDDKKTWEENFLYKYIQAFLSEANPISLIPGYGDMIELLKNGELSDDAMSVIGKFKSILETTRDALSGKGKGWYRDLEDTAGQMAQLFTNIPAKNIMRDLRAAATWFGGNELIGTKGYANRPTSGAVIRYQTESAIMTADNMLGVINSLMGDAGFQTKNSAYYQRLFDAMQGGNQAEADSIREYLTLGKGVKEESISSGLKDVAKKSMEAADADEWMIEQGMMDGTSTITKQLKAGEITFDEAKRLMKKADPKLTDNDVWWKLDRIRYQQEKKLDEAPGGNYYRLTDAINANKAEEIRKAVKDLMAHGVTKEQIIKKIGDWKTPYKTADTAAERRVIRDALQKTYKVMGLTPEDADAKIDSWYPESNKNKKTTKKNSKKKDTSGSISKGTLSASAGGSSGGNSELFWRNMYANTTGKLMGKGNIDLNSRKVVHNEDGSISTEISMSFYDEETGKEVLIPTVIDGKIVDDDTAIDHYYETGEYLGRFDTPEEAEEYAERLHERQDWYYNR